MQRSTPMKSRVDVMAAMLAILPVGVCAVLAQSPTARAATTAIPRIDLKADCGAKGDGISNDTAAFQKAAELIQKAGNGTLIIPEATYIVGRQTHELGQYPYYKHQPVFKVKDLDGLLIEGNGAVLRVAPGLRYGSFDKETGDVYNPPAMPFCDFAYRVNVGRLLDVTSSRNVVIRNIELDGNLSNLILGGAWGDTGRQVEGFGIFAYNNTDVHFDRVHSHHHALDGAVIGWTGLKEGDPATPHTLTDCTFEYNGRQGLSWVGGRGLTAYRCKFNHTQRGINNGAPLASAPGAGLDVEGEDAVCRDGYFEDCEFVDNGGCGMVADSAKGGYSRFKNCTFGGTTAWSVWSKEPGLEYEDCSFYGSAVHAFGSPNPDLATRWTRCTFEDKPWTDGRVYRQNSGDFLVEINGDMDNVLFDACTFTANTSKSIWCSGKGVRFSDCTVTHRMAGIGPGDFQCLIRGGELMGCHFKEKFPPQPTSNWHIAADGSRILDGKPTTVDGPRVHWGSPEGPVGLIAPGN